MLILLAALAAAPPLQAAEQPKPAPTRQAAVNDRDKIVCKRFIETGSLVRGYRTCKTKWEWERERENINAPRTTSGACASAASGVC